MPLDQNKLGDRIWRKQWKLTNRVGRLGRQGVHGPVENREHLVGGTSKVKKLRTPRSHRLR